MTAAAAHADPNTRRTLSGTHGKVRILASRRSLAWRVFFTNAAVLVGVSAFYVLSPATISAPVAVAEVLVLVAAIALSLFVNLLLLDRAFVPLDELRGLMGRVDPLKPGRRVELERADADVAALAEAFNEMLERLETERRESAQRALAAQEDERRRVARELHDELGQMLTGVLLLLDEVTKAPPERAAEALHEAREAARYSLDDVRRIVRDLRPEALDDLGLSSALHALVSAFAQQTGIDVERRLEVEAPELSAAEELVLYRIAQEALTNVARHAEAQHTKVALDRIDGHLRLSVRDDGRGFEGPARHDGGICGMRERALLVRGAVTVTSADGAGTEVCFLLPERRS